MDSFVSVATRGASLLAIPTALLLFLVFRRSRSSIPYPPGPKPLPLVDNAFDIPSVKPYLTYTQWQRQYNSSLIHLQALGQHVLVINSFKDAVELLEKRAQVYSSRPYIPMVELLQWHEFNLVLLPHNSLWRRHRRLFHQMFRKEAAGAFNHIIVKKTEDMIQSVLSTPHDFRAHVKTLAGAIVLSVVYDYDVSPTGDRFVDLVQSAIHEVDRAILPGSHLVNTFPVLRHLPPWFPGAGFHKVAEKSRQLTWEMRMAPVDMVKKKMATGAGSQCVLGQLLERNDAQGGSKEEETVITNVSAVAYAAGADTSYAGMVSFILAMALHPHIQQKAQAELDRVVGHGELPDFSDRDSLPYTEAIFRELLRWRPITPLAVPHATTEDDVYEGYWIPKGTIVMGNAWAMTHDETIYPEPDRFMPERFLDASGNLNNDDRILSFGFGRRICAGRYLASNSLWFFIASMLAMFDIKKAVDESGKEIEIDPDYEDGVVSHPKDFQCRFIPRSTRTFRNIDVA
ncbi:hypothetical protein AX16_010778 [Volvariella volvacea WC 439]|nr:hypothetical protein AX16_010778 [Volvariella volvacea WC 439]